MMIIEYGVGHRDGSVDGPFSTEDEMWNCVLQNGGSPVGRLVINPEKNGPWKDLDPVNGLCYANPIYKKVGVK